LEPLTITKHNLPQALALDSLKVWMVTSFPGVHYKLVCFCCDFGVENIHAPRSQGLFLKLMLSPEFYLADFASKRRMVIFGKIAAALVPPKSSGN